MMTKEQAIQRFPLNSLFNELRWLANRYPTRKTTTMTKTQILTFLDSAELMLEQHPYPRYDIFWIVMTDVRDRMIKGRPVVVNKETDLLLQFQQNRMELIMISRSQ